MSINFSQPITTFKTFCMVLGEEYLPVKLKDSTWLVVVALDNTSMAVDNRGASSAMLEDNMAARIVNEKRLNLIMMWGM